jgi:hypothetical protein
LEAWAVEKETNKDTKKQKTIEILILPYGREKGGGFI